MNNLKQPHVLMTEQDFLTRFTGVSDITTKCRTVRQGCHKTEDLLPKETFPF